MTGLDLKIYQTLKGKISAVANGTESSTSFLLTWEELGITQTTWTQDELTATIIADNDISDAAIQEITEKIGYDSNRVPVIIDCLLADCPYELYWYDKTASVVYPTQPQVGASSIKGVVSIYFFEKGITISFPVASAYAGDDSYTTNTSLTSTAANAAAAARQVVADNTGKSDYEKLVAYKDYICSAVSYNSDAASDNYTGGYGDPWQLIHVFDGDSSTNVVCEGYSKAFQYLCDLGGLTCYTVTGNMTGGTGAGAHMWNIVTLDGENYLVDVTNSDTGTVGQDGSLFLAGTSGSVDGGYTVSGVTFTYDDDTKSLYGDSILTLAAEDYTEPVTEANGVAKVVMEDGTTTYYKTITEAFAAVGANDTATITLLRDAPVESGKITVSGDVTLVGDGHTLSGAYASYADGLINIPAGAKLTIMSGEFANIGSADSKVFTVYVSGGTLVINGGTITATGSTAAAVQVYSGSAEISGGTFTGTVSGYGTGYGIYVNSSGNAKLTGGTFTGSYSAVCVLGGKVSNLLETGYIYCKDGVYASGDSESLSSGTYTVAECKDHRWSAWSDAGDGTHTRTCEYCGKTESAKHNYGTDGQCSDCSAHAVASVKIGEEPIYYGTIEDVWARAKGKTATVTLLSDVSTNNTGLTVAVGDNITLESEQGKDYTLNLGGGELTVSAGSFTLVSGGLRSGNSCIALQNGKVSIEGGSVAGYNGVYVTGGSLDVRGGSLVGNNQQGSGISMANGSVRVYDDVTVTGGYGIQVNQNCPKGSSLAVFGGSFTGKLYSLYNGSSSCSVVLSGGTFNKGSFFACTAPVGCPSATCLRLVISTGKVMVT